MPRHLLLAALMLAFGSVGLQAQQLVCGRTPLPPAIDGSHDDPCWRSAMTAGGFSVLGSAGTERAVRQTTARAAWDGDALYILVVCQETDPSSVTANVTQRDGQVWLEDCVELFLQPDPTTDRTFHFIVNPLGVLFDEDEEGAGFNADVRIAVDRAQLGWTVEMALPWDQLRTTVPQNGSEWGFNVARVHRPQEPTEWTTWAPLELGRKQFGVPSLFGRLLFSTNPQSGWVSGLRMPDGLIRNPDFTAGEGKPEGWSLSAGSRVFEVPDGSGMRAIGNDVDYGIASQALNIPVSAGDIFTIEAVVRASEDARIGIAAVQEMEDGRPDDLYPFWKIEAAGEYRRYIGRIVVDKGARRIFSFRLYRANREGTVEYAYAQMFPGLRGVLGITEAARCVPPDWRATETSPWQSPCARLFTPLPGEKIRALVFIGEFQRDAAELAQRLDLDYDLVYCPTFRGSGKVDEVVAFDAERILRRLSRGEYSLIILAGRPSEQSIIDSIIASVEGGTGLLAIEPLAGGGAAKPEVLKTLLDILPAPGKPDLSDAAHILGAVTPQALSASSPTKPAPSWLSSKEHGAGRIARICWPESVTGLTPFTPGLCLYWEYRWAALCKAVLWAAKREPPCRIESVACDDHLRLRMQGRMAAQLSVIWSSPFQTVASDTRSIGPDETAVAVPLPDSVRNAPGPVIALVMIRDGDGNALDVAACLVPTHEPLARLSNLVAPTEAAPGEEFPVSVDCEFTGPGTVCITARITDAWGRIVAADERTIEEPTSCEFSLQIAEPLSVYHRISVEATLPRDPSTIVGRLDRDLFLPAVAETHLDDFALAAGYAAMPVRCPSHLEDAMVAFLRANGIRSCTVNEYMIRRGMSAFGGVSGAGMRNRGTGNRRAPCFSDPAEVEAMARRVSERIAARRSWGFYGYNMDDETHLHQDGSVELCTCDFCRTGFAAWAREQFGTIAAANAEWGTDYASFEDIQVPLLAGMQGADNPARWVDFRLYQERTWANAYAHTHDAVRARIPDARMSFTNPYRYNSLSGTDFALWTPHEELLLRYFHRHVADRNRSWTDAPMVSWFGYHSNAAECGHFVWWFALNGGLIPIWWDPVEPWAYSGKEGFTPWYMLDPLWRPTGRSQAVSAAAQHLQTGLGKALRIAKRPEPEAVIIHSQPSMHVSYAVPALKLGRPTDDGYNAYRASDDAMAAALKRHGFAYEYALPEQLDAARLAGVQLVALPSCVALPDAACDALRAFVNSGGKLIADVMPATFDEHGKPRAVSPIADLFDGARAVLLQAGDSDATTRLTRCIAGLNCAPAVTWQTSTGELPRQTELYRFALGRNQLIGLVRLPEKGAAGEGPVTVHLPEPGYVYDCRTAAYLGHLERITLDIAAGDAVFLAVLSYQPSGLDVQAEVASGRFVVRASIVGAPEAANHVFRISVTPPGAGAPVEWYSRNVAAPDGKASLELPLARNDPAGEWVIEVRDVLTGITKTLRVAVTHDVLKARSGDQP
ncbi:MAG: beta-galactosidase [Armatimonadetes bacterium]|nr:beta-galactosidase [Armatimonadota bacterium]